MQMKKELKRKNEDNNGKKDLEIWETKKRASAKEDGLKNERNLPVHHREDFLAMYVKNLADFLSVYLAGHITLRKISSMAMAAGIVFLAHALRFFVKLL